MIVLLILGIVVLVLALISLIRVGVRAEYVQDRLAVRLLAGPVKITLYPRKAKKPRKAKGHKAQPAPKEEKKLPPLEELIPLAKQLLPMAAEAAGRFKNKVRIDLFDLDVTVASTDPVRTALNYGKLNMAIGMFWPLVEQNFKVKEWHIRTRMDFVAQHATAELHAAATLTIGQIIVLGAWAAARVLPILSQQKKGKKSPQETQKEAV